MASSPTASSPASGDVTSAAQSHTHTASTASSSSRSSPNSPHNNNNNMGSHSPPCCGKRPRTPPDPPEVVEGAARSQEACCEEEPVVEGESQQSLPIEESEEPTAKMPRNSPTFSGDEDDEDDELLEINQQQQQQQESTSKEEGEDSTNSKPLSTTPNARASKETADSSIPSTPKKSPPKRSQRHTTNISSAKKPLPLAPTLKEFMKAGATKRFSPHPAWYKGDQNGNPSARRSRPRTQTYSTSSGRPSRSLTPIPPPVGRDVTAAAAAAAPVGSPLRPGLMVAPDNGLLPDGIFDGGVLANLGSPTYYNNVSPSRYPLPPHLLGTATRNGDAASPSPSQETPSQQQPSSELDDNSDHSQNDNPRPSTFGRDFDPALLVTIRENATEASLALLEYGAPVEAENAKGVTPLILASQRGNLFLVRELLRRGALASRATSNGITAVMQAAHFGHLECLELLLQVGGSHLQEMANFNQTTALMRAAQEGHVDIVRSLLDHGASVNRRNRVLMTALMLASQRGHADVCQVLVDRGAELDSMTAQRSTSLMLASKRGQTEVVRVLVTAGCDLNVTDSRGRTAREVAQRREWKELEGLLDANVQLDLMQQQQRKQRNYDMIRFWNLLQQERAMIPLSSFGDEPPLRQLTIHHMVQELTPKTQLSPLSSHRMPPTLPYHLSQKSTQALLRTMALPAPLVECITKFLPMPLLWERRVSMLTKQSVTNADASVRCSLDLVDEILEESGFVEALAAAKVTPPTHYASWRDWRVYCRLKCRRGGPVRLPDDLRDRPEATTACVPKPQDTPTALEMRQQVGFLQILANRTPVLAHVLKHEPYKMPASLIQQLITTSDIQSLVRRMGSRGVHFEPTVAMDLIVLVNKLCSWYAREREDKPYPIYPAVVHPPLPKPRHRALPIRVPAVTVHTPFQYDPYQPSASPDSSSDAVERQRPSAPAPPSD